MKAESGLAKYRPVKSMYVSRWAPAASAVYSADGQSYGSVPGSLAWIHAFRVVPPVGFCTVPHCRVVPLLRRLADQSTRMYSRSFQGRSVVFSAITFPVSPVAAL